MAPITRTLKIAAAASLALAALASSAEARHHHRHHGHARVVAAPAPAPALVPAHQRPEYVGLASARLPLIDLGLGPVFPFGGWPK